MWILMGHIYNLDRIWWNVCGFDELFSGDEFLFMRMYKRAHSYFWVRVTNMFNIKYNLPMNIFGKPIHCVENHFVKFNSYNVHQA